MGKKMRKMAAFAMAAAMAVSTPVGAAGGTSGAVFSGARVTSGANAGSGATSGTESHVFYKQNITTVVVPTALTVAFNPEGFEVDLGNGEVVKDQVVSKSVAMVSEAIDNHKVGVTFKISTNSSKLKFVTDPDDVNSGKEHKVLLQLATADKNTISVYSGTGSGTGAGSGAQTKKIDVKSGSLTVSPEQLARAKMTTAGSATGGVVALTSGASGTQANFLLGKAVYDYKTINLATYSGTNVISGTLKSIGVTSGVGVSGTKKEDWTYTGVTGFKFTGMLNKYANWYELGETDTITVVPTYSFEEMAVDENNLVDETVISGTGAFLGIEGASGTVAKATAVYSGIDDSKLWIAKGATVSDTFADGDSNKITNLKVNGKSVAYTMLYGFITVSDTEMTSKGISTAAGTKYTVTFTFDGKSYTASCTR